MRFKFTVGEDKPPTLPVDNRGKDVLSMDGSAMRYATLNVGVRVTTTCHALCNNRVYKTQCPPE